MREAKRTDSTLLDYNADWTDYRAAGASSPEDMEARIVEVLKTVELEETIFELGLRSAVDAAHHPGPRRKRAARARGDTRAARRARHAGPGRAVRRRALQPQRDAGGEPAVRHADRQEDLRHREPGGQRLRAPRAARNRARRRPAQDRAQARRDHGRAVQRPAAGARILRALQLHPAGRPAGGEGGAGARGRRRAGEDRGGRPRHADGAAVQDDLRPAPPWPDRRGLRGAHPAGAPLLRRAPARRDARRHRILRRGALQRRRDAAGQHPVRQGRDRPGAGQRAASPRCCTRSSRN